MGMSHNTFRKLRQADQHIQDALDAGRQVMHDKLVGRLYERAMGKDQASIAALIFILKAKFGYRDNGDETGEQRPSVIINLPSALPLSSFQPAITVDGNADEANGCHLQVTESRRG
jgi:hypothetical protein